MADVYISFKSPLQSVSRGDIEQDLENLLGRRGSISGSGGALYDSAANIDLHLKSDDKRRVAKIVDKVVDLLRKLRVPKDTELLIFQGDVKRRRPVYDKSFPWRAAASRAKPRKQAEPTLQSHGNLPAAGDAYLCPVPDTDVLTVCRILRVLPNSSHPVSVAATNWFGKTPPRTLSDKRIKEPLALSYVGARGPWRSWVSGDLPGDFTILGTIPPTSEEKQFVSSNHSNWEVFLRTIKSQWNYANRQQAKK